MSAKVLLIGCGKMGGAMLDGWLAAGSVSAVAVVEPFEHAVIPDDKRVVRTTSVDDVDVGFSADIMVLAVKPQMMEAVLPSCKRFADQGAAVLSIAAGKQIERFQAEFGDQTAIVRAMPNTPAAIGKGTTVLVASDQTSAEQRDLAESLIAAVGSVDWVEDEALIDAVTALSGGGPAYVFLLVECLAEAGTKAGLPADMAMRLARNTVIGSGALLEQADEPAATLRKNVTSPGGTTQAALGELMDESSGIGPIFDRAIAAAKQRSQELAKPD